MKQIFSFGSILLITLVFLSSCASNDFLKALKIETSSEKQKSANEKTIADLKKQLARAKKNETTLDAEILKLKNKIDKQATSFNTELADLETLFENKEASYHRQIGTLKNELDKKEALISVQGKVIGLLDDADQTLQKSINDQLNNK